MRRVVRPTVVAAVLAVLLSTSPAAAAPTGPQVGRFAVPAATQQLIVVRADTWSTSYATLTAYERDGAGRWRVVRGPMKARLGSRGLVVGTQRRQGSRTTPAGYFPLTRAFGRWPDPGTALPYVQVDSRHYWVGDNASPYYNQMRLSTHGGFDRRQSEHLVRYNPHYDYSLVVDFNTQQVRWRGSAIFLHVNGTGATAGCVSVTRTQLAWLLRWLKPGKRPHIVIGQDDWLRSR